MWMDQNGVVLHEINQKYRQMLNDFTMCFIKIRAVTVHIESKSLVSDHRTEVNED